MSETEPMDRMNFSIPAEVKRRAQARGDVNWSAVVTKAISDRLHALEILDRVAAKADLSKADADEIADMVDRGMQKRSRRART